MPDTTAQPAKSNWIMDKFVPFAKWWFDMLRSFFVVALLAYVAQKTNNIYLKTLAQVSTIFFSLYIVAYLTELLTPQFRYAHSIKYRPLKWFVLGALVLFGSYYGYRWMEVITSAIEDVVKYQAK
jgi:hypothetical protein